MANLGFKHAVYIAVGITVLMVLAFGRMLDALINAR